MFNSSSHEVLCHEIDDTSSKYWAYEQKTTKKTVMDTGILNVSQNLMRWIPLKRFKALESCPYSIFEATMHVCVFFTSGEFKDKL